MSVDTPHPSAHELQLTGLAQTERLARDLARIARAGDVIALSGDLGAGKSAFARAILRFMADDATLEVPSPTFTLVQDYALPAGRVLHADLYRLRGPEDLHELGLVEDRHEAIMLVEWPDRAGSVLDGPHRLDVVLTVPPGQRDDVRQVTLLAGAGWRERLGLAVAIRHLLDKAGWGDATRHHMQGDASTRAYERLERPDGARAILMIAPPRPDGPPVKNGKPYSQIAHLAETVHAFVAVDLGLRALGLSAPAIIAQDLGGGLLLLEDLGQHGVLDPAGSPVPERYRTAAEVLAYLHAQTLPTILPVVDGRDHVLPEFDREAMLIEAELLLDWYAPHIAQIPVTPRMRSAFRALWSALHARLLAQDPAQSRTWVLRDMHSPNLIWLPERTGLARVGLIDFQDAVLGHGAYDVVSLAQDARVDVPADLELGLISAYAAARSRAQHDRVAQGSGLGAGQWSGAGFDLAAFAEAYAILGAQRATKILGIFARLDRRDGKPAYLRHLPRIEAYLRRNLAHPVLADLRTWYAAEMPVLIAEPASGGRPDDTPAAPGPPATSPA